MKKTILIVIAFALVSSCNVSETTTTDNDLTSDSVVVEQIATTPEITTLKEFEGVYVKGGHDNAWILTIKEENNKLVGTLMTIKGMLPPPEYLASGEKVQDAKSKEVTLELDLDTNSFKSNLGTGIMSINDIEFDGIKDASGEKLFLERDDSYNN